MARFKRKERVTVKNIIAYLQGNFRYKIFYGKYTHWLMRKHIRSQIEYRINSMDKRCFENGSCHLCGCQTTHLQMANKPCRGECYPKMLSKDAWHRYKGRSVWIDDIFWDINTTERKFILKHKA